MNNLFKKALILFFAISSLTGLCSLKNTPRQYEIQRSSRDQINQLQSSIDRLLLSFDSKAHVGIEVASVKTGQKLYQKNADQLFIPASNLKIFTAAASLASLGQDFRFETELYTDGEVRDKILKGNLYLRGSGNPELSLDDLQEIVFQLKLLQIDQISGDLIVDNSEFDGIAQGPGWMWDDGAEFWNSPMDALVLNHNCMKLWVKPASELSKPPLIYVYPKTSFVNVQNLATTVLKEGELKVAKQNVTTSHLIEVKGAVQIENETKEYLIPIDSPHFYAAHLFKDLLSKYGMQFKGKIRADRTPKFAKTIARHLSPPLAILVRNMMKNSDNLAADCLLKKLGSVRYNESGTWQNGAQALREFLTVRAGMDVSQMVVLDGSGLSRYNLISPHHLVSFLIWVQKQPQFAAEFVSSLPIAGVDGTLKKRMTESPIQGNIRAKTATMTGVSALSGYVTTKDGDLLAFSIIVNGLLKSTKEAKAQLEDQICTILSKFSYH